MKNNGANLTDITGRTLAGIIPTLVSGLYSDKFDIVREYCQNSYDAILKKFGAQAAKEGRIDIRIEGTELIITDNGTGMDTEVVRNLATIGYSTKDTFDQVGYRGIGRLSGICGADAIHFITKHDTENIEHAFVINAAGLEKALLDRTVKFSEDAGEMLARYSKHMTKQLASAFMDKSYTTVVMHGVRAAAGKLLDHRRLREYLELNLPVKVDPHYAHEKNIEELYREHETQFPNISIKINGRQLYKPYHELTGANKFRHIVLNNSRGHMLGVAWFMWNARESGMVNPERLRGLRLRYRGFTVGQADDMRNVINVQPPQVPDWFAGEVIVVDERARVSSDRSRFEDSVMRTELYRSMHECLGKSELEKIARGVSRETSLEKDISKAEVLAAELLRIEKTGHVSDEHVAQVAKKAARAREKVDKKLQLFDDDRKQERMTKVIKDLDHGISKAKHIASVNADIAKECRLSAQAIALYKHIRKEIEKSFDGCMTAGELITKIEKRLLKEMRQ